MKVNSNCVLHPVLGNHRYFVGTCFALRGLGCGYRIRNLGKFPLSQTPSQLMERKPMEKGRLLFCTSGRQGWKLPPLQKGQIFLG